MEQQNTSPHITPISYSECEMREITSASDPLTLEWMQQYEKVHRLQDTAERDGRLAPPANDNDNTTDDWEQRCWNKHAYGLFIPGSHEPLAVVYVKLEHQHEDPSGRVPDFHLPGNIGDVLNQPAHPEPDANLAVFYSISNNLKREIDGRKLILGENGFSAGEELIHRVAGHLQNHCSIHSFATLSPLRSGTDQEAKGFAQWFETMLTDPEQRDKVLTRREQAWIDQFLARDPSTDAELSPEERDEALQMRTNIAQGAVLAYLTDTKNPDKPKRALDTVAHFHFGNGAMLARIHTLLPEHATPSDVIGGNGIMINYRYEPNKLAERKSAYEAEGTTALSPSLQRVQQARHQAVSAHAENVVPLYR